MRSIYSGKKPGSSFLTFTIFLLSIVSIAFGTIGSSANSVSNEKNLEDGRMFSNLKEAKQFGFLTNNITTLFNGNDIGQISFGSPPSRSEKIGIAGSTVFDEFDAWVGFYVSNGFRADGEQMNLGENLAVRRKQALEELIQINPKAAFEKAIPAEIFNRLPSFITEHSEKRISANGDFLVYIFDEMNRANESHIERYVVIGNSRYEAVVYGRRVAMTTKLNIPLQGIVIGDTIVVDENPVRKIDSAEYAERAVDESKLGADGVAAEVGGKVVYFSDQLNLSNLVRQQIEWESKIGPVRPRENLAPDELASPWTEGAKTVLLIRVDFPDKVGEPLDHYNQPLTSARAQNLINGQVNPFYVSSSYNKTSMQATVTPVVRLPQTRAFYAQGFNFNVMLNDARSAARAAGFETDNFDLDIVAFSYTSSIGWAGIAGVGGKGNLLNGAFYMQETAHELGHNYGLLHANLWRTTDGSPIGQGTHIEYGDCYDDMGACVNQSANSHFNTHYKRLLDWLTDANVQTVTSSGTYRIFAQDSSSPGGLRTLKIKKDNTNNYWIEFRQLFPNAVNGALLRWDYASENFQETQLLDMNSATSTLNDAPLMIGQSFYDSASQIRITIVGKGNTTPESLDIKVELGQSTGGCTFSLSSTNTNIGAGGGTGSVNVTAAAGTGCAWTAASNVPWVTINGGSNGTGNGTVSFTVQPNTTSARTGTITVAGQTFTISQAGTITTTPALSINNVSLSEGNSGTTAFNFTASLSAASTQTVLINFATAGDTAVAGLDYTTANGTLTFAPGETSKTVTIQVVGDTLVEPNETFTVNLSGAANATIADGQGTGMILNDDVAVACTFSISPTNINVEAAGAAGNTISVITQPGCQWNAASNDSWITITGGSSGINNGSVTFSVDTNTGAVRTGTITVGGRLVFVNQSTTIISFSSQTRFDFDGDGKADVSVFRPSNGGWYINQSANGFTGIAFGTGGDRIVPADYDGDGKTDVAVYRGGTWYLNRSLAGFTGVAFGNANDVPQPGDFDGDGKAELAVFRPSNGYWYVMNLVTNEFTATQFGQTGDQPVAADYDGDARADYAVYRNGGWYILRSSQGFIGIQFGEAADKPVAADYDGDGKADVAVFRPSNGTWYLQQSAAGFTGIAFGTLTDIPSPADYDGDGRADVAVFRPSNGTWYMQQSTAGFTGAQFGATGDKPVPSAFVQ